MLPESSAAAISPPTWDTSTRCGQGQVAKGSFILFVNDGSRDRTWDIITELHAKDTLVCGCNLAANVGHQHALWAGLTAAKERADILVTIDADLQARLIRKSVGISVEHSDSEKEEFLTYTPNIKRGCAYFDSAPECMVSLKLLRHVNACKRVV